MFNGCKKRKKSAQIGRRNCVKRRKSECSFFFSLVSCLFGIASIVMKNLYDFIARRKNDQDKTQQYRGKEEQEM